MLNDQRDVSGEFTFSIHDTDGHTMSRPDPPPTLVALKGDSESARLEWSDGVTAALPWRLLREKCPCASCQARPSAPAALLPVLRPEETQPIQAVSMQPVGNYAYSIAFNDGHNSGIYTLETLYALCRQS